MPLPALPTDRHIHTLLVVDDQPSNIQVLHQAFCDDHRVLKALSGAEALQVCQQQRPDLILLDVVMPDMDGFEVCQRLKDNPLTHDIPVIFVTAHEDTAHETRCLALGAADFITKPFNMAVVRARVSTQLGLARSTSLLAATLEASTDGIVVTDGSGEVLSMNRSCIQMWGLPAELRAPTSLHAVQTAMRQQLLQMRNGCGTPATLLLRADIDAGCNLLMLTGERYVERHSAPLNINGNLRGQVVIFRDVTEQRRAANALQRLNESLESRIQARTQELETAMHLAQSASQAKSDFLSNMSHEIRTPMNAVIGLAFLALESDPNPKQRRYLEKIRQAGEHLLGLVNDVLDFSKIEAGKLVLEETDFQLSQVLASVASVSAHAAQAKGLSLSFDAAPELSIPLRGDPTRLGQILLNYVGNAIKFTEHGAVRVLASAQQRLDAECLLRIEVHDTGIGLAPAQMAQLFQMFHQVDASTTRNHGGTGLGLAVCKQLAELMGGEVGVSSQPGRGSVFWFTGRVRLGKPTALEQTLPQAPRDIIRGTRVLVVEDNLMNQEVANGLLEEVGITVVTANNGQEALDLLATERFDCVLMDVQMPVMDGLQATRLIRQDPRLADLPVLAMTANASSEDRTRCLAAGMNDFLTKPVLPDGLYAALARWIVQRTTAAVAAPSEPAAPEPATASPGAGPQVVDLSILHLNVGGDAQKVSRYGQMFCEGLPESLAELNAALEHGSLTALADLGHRMKSSARMVGAMGLADLCESLEALRQGGEIDKARTTVDQISLMTAQVSADITAGLAGGPP